jgi:hypothetical protein
MLCFLDYPIPSVSRTWMTVWRILPRKGLQRRVQQQQQWLMAPPQTASLQAALLPLAVSAQACSEPEYPHAPKLDPEAMSGSDVRCRKVWIEASQQNSP